MTKWHLTGAHLDRRRDVRYGLCYPVLFSWATETGELQHKEGGFSRDVSTGGIYVTCDRDLPTSGTPIDIEVLIRAPESEAVALRLSARGVVVRQGYVGEPIGFGATANFELVP